MRGRSKRPPFDAITFDQLGNVVRQLAQNPAINLILELRALGNRVEVPSAARLTATVTDRKSSGGVGELVAQFSVCVGDVERLNQLQTWSAGWGIVNFVRFQTA